LHIDGPLALGLLLLVDFHTMTREQIRLAVFLAAEKEAAPTWAILCQAEIESGFRNDLVSSDGAAGVLQIRPVDGAQPGYGVAPISASQILIPGQATTWACRYLDAIRQYRGVGNYTWAQAFLKYNVGPDGDIRTASRAYKNLAAACVALLGEPDPLA
jgi:hypothetical protein